ncbi:MAG TPA: MAPEG family protein [Xanthobacteraceae bacterium]|jgi:uncharacterized MAPEG superfamily protein|nr:MAPEG family protein [Xanthobacteraceae bacterium]
MTAELYWMTLTVLMTALFWVPCILDRAVTRGLIGAVWGTTPETGEKQSLWAQRAIKAHANAVENLAIFVPAVLTLNILHISTPATRMAASVYFFARLAHFVLYSAGIPFGRTSAFTVGWIAQIALLATILGWK